MIKQELINKLVAIEKALLKNNDVIIKYDKKNNIIKIKEISYKKIN